jgi:hypothetical protein
VTCFLRHSLTGIHNSKINLLRTESKFDSSLCSCRSIKDPNTMKLSIILSSYTASLASAAYQCPVMPKPPGADIQFAYIVQNLLTTYYDSVPINASFFSGLPNATAVSPINGMTLAENTVTNIEGLRKQAQLGSEAIREFYGSYDTMQLYSCHYDLPSATTGLEHLKNAFFLEATMCGGFIGLTAIVQAPQAAFLMARLAVEHGTHASNIRSMMQAVGFYPNSTSLAPAFTPTTILESSNSTEVGKLGSYLGGCAHVPVNPCGGIIEIGPLLANLTNQMSYTPSCD